MEFIMNTEEDNGDVLDVLRDMASSLKRISSSLVVIEEDGVTLNNKVTEAFTSAIADGGLDSILGGLSNATKSTSDIRDVVDAIKNPIDSGGSAQSLIDSLREAKERLSTISSTLNAANSQDESQP
jgi:hypothetical protein